jgi:hypothetical protein
METTMRAAQTFVLRHLDGIIIAGLAVGVIDCLYNKVPFHVLQQWTGSVGLLMMLGFLTAANDKKPKTLMSRALMIIAGVSMIGLGITEIWFGTHHLLSG